MQTKRTITRLEFLRGSGMLAAGLTILPRTAWAAAQQHGVQVSAAKLARYRIVVPDQATAIEQQAAERLQQYVADTWHHSLPIVKESGAGSAPAFYLGATRLASAKKVDRRQLAQDGFAFYPAGKGLIVAGGTGQGLLYGVYGLLELWGLRMYTSKATALPHTQSLTLPAKTVVVPPVTYRTTSYPDTHDARYTEWHRLSSRSDWGLFVHTFNELVSPDRYGASHPEYFSLIDGKRLPGTQLCLSNPEVLTVLLANLRQKIAAKLGATYWSVSQNDNDQYCRCEPCTALNTTYGNAPSGSILYFVNQVAKACPDKIISTLAYWYSRKPPQNIQAEHNVNIMLCNIESRRQAPVYETDPAFSNELIAWGAIAGNILIWDYTIQFTNLVSPFPNLHTLKPNIRFYLEHHVNSLFMQSNGQVGGEMAGLRAYMLCELMWNPEADDSALMDDYLNGYYGAAGPFIRHYIDRMRESLVTSGLKLNIFGGPEDAKDGYLSQQMMTVYSSLFDQAEKAVVSDAGLLQRVKIARLPLLYATIQIGRNEVDTSRSMFAHSADGKVFVKPAMPAMVRQLVEGCKLDGVTKLRERSTPPDDYQASYDRVFTKVAATQTALSFAKAVQPVTLPEGGTVAAHKLTDGLFGSWESWSAPDVNWVYWKGQHMDLVLDLGEVREIRTVEMDFLNVQAQPDWNLLVLPAYVSYATSVDGAGFGAEIRIANPNDPNPKTNPNITKVPVQSFRAELGAATRARYLRVHAESILKMPSWHIRAGHPAEIYTDQIVVT